MDREKLESLCCEKLSRELAGYKSGVLKGSREEIYGAAYEIDSVITIYELLAEEAERLETGLLEAMLVFPNLLLFLYQRWLKCEDSRREEFIGCIRGALIEIEKEKKEEKEDAA